MHIHVVPNYSILFQMNDTYIWSTCSISHIRKVGIIQNSPVVAFKMKGQIILLKFATPEEKDPSPHPHFLFPVTDSSIKM